MSSVDTSAREVSCFSAAAAAAAAECVCGYAAGLGGHFVMTGSVKSHLHNLARAALIGRYPILLQVTDYSTIVGILSLAYAAAHKITIQLLVYK